MLHAAGILNTRWEDFSAVEVAKSVGLIGVAWDAVADDTPGTLELTLWYPQRNADSLRMQLAEIDGVEDYDLQSLS